MTTAWDEVKARLLPRYGFLLPFTTTIEKATIDRINELLKSGKMDQFHYEPLLIESLFADCSTLLDRCLAYRREAREFEVEAVRFAMEYEKAIELLKIEEKLDNETSESLLLTAEAKSLSIASEKFGKVSDLGPGFSTQALAGSKSADARSGIWDTRLQILSERRATLQKWQDAYMARHKAPGAAHNYEERMDRLVQFMAEDLYEAYLKARFLFQGVQRIYSRRIDLPPLTEGILDELVGSVRRAARFVDAQRQNEIMYDLVIPLCQPWNASGKALIDTDQLIEYGKSPYKKPLTFELTDVFFNQTGVRLKAMGLSFGNVNEGRSTSSMTSRSKQWGSAGDTDTNGTSDSTAWANEFAKYRIRATVHTPAQTNLDGSKYWRPPVVLGNLSIYGGVSPIALESGLQCQNIDPSGRWSLFLENNAVHSGPKSMLVFKKNGKSFIEDLKLHLRIASTFTSGDSAFRPNTVSKRRRSAA